MHHSSPKAFIYTTSPLMIAAQLSTGKFTSAGLWGSMTRVLGDGMVLMNPYDFNS
jgi:hypothetical protein